MKRPLANKRPIGPFAQNLSPNNEPLAANEIRILLGRLVDTIENDVGALKAVRDDEVNEDVGEQVISMTSFNSRTLDSAAQKLAAQHKERAGHLPRGWNEYTEKAAERDELLDKLR